MADIKRQTAFKCTISQITQGKYIVQQGWEPNYIVLNDEKISRINLIAVVVQKEGSVLTVEDGTGKIEVRLFQEPQKADNLSVGDIILIIGRPREYSNKRYLVPEIMRKINDKKWVAFRKKELELLYPEDKTKIKQEEDSQEESLNIPEVEEQEFKIERGTNYSQVILETIQRLDKGDGAQTQSVIKKCGLDNAEKYIETLLNEGEIFEIRAGRLKILE